MRRTPLLLLLSSGLLLGCGQQNETRTGGSVAVENSISVDPADLEKLADWQATSLANARLTEMLADVMAEIKDRASAEAAVSKLKDLAPKFAAINRAEKALGEPSKDDRKLVLANLAAAHKKFDAAYTPLMDNEELKVIVSQAINDAYVGNVKD